jgi:hypothetical protein
LSTPRPSRRSCGSERGRGPGTSTFLPSAFSRASLRHLESDREAGPDRAVQGRGALLRRGFAQARRARRKAEAAAGRGRRVVSSQSPLGSRSNSGGGADRLRPDTEGASVVDATRPSRVGGHHGGAAAAGEAGCAGAPERRRYPVPSAGTPCGSDGLVDTLLADVVERDAAGAQAAGLDAVWIERLERRWPPPLPEAAGSAQGCGLVLR